MSEVLHPALAHARKTILEEALGSASSALSGNRDFPAGWEKILKNIKTDDELHDWISTHLNLRIPRGSCCPEHTPPFEAVADAYFARYPRTVWVGGRGSCKSVSLAALSLTEAITLGAGVTILGGSGEQSQRVHKYMEGEDTNLPEAFWGAPQAPKWLLKGDPTKRDTRLKSGGWISALVASPTSVRGPHPQRLRGDEVDEMDIDIWESAQGQPMPVRNIMEQTVGSSTWQHANGTMTRELGLALERGWKINKWCINCVSRMNGGFIDDDFIERKRNSVDERTWRVEYLCEEPTVEDRAIDADAVDRMFVESKGRYPCDLGQEVIIEPPIRGASYSTGADWGKARDKTVIVTIRTDVHPFRIVAVTHMGQIPFPQMVAAFNEQVDLYGSGAAHDATGLGAVIDDYIEVFTEGVKLVGARRSQIFSSLIAGVERDEFKGNPQIPLLYNALKYATYADLYGSKHPPDAFVALALAYYAAEQPGSLIY